VAARPLTVQVLESYGLAFKSVAEAVAAVVDTLGMAPCEGTGAVKPGTSKHNAYLSGVFLGGVKVLARMQVSMDAAGDAGGGSGPGGCVLKIGIRSEDRDVSQLLMDTIS
jgi:coatomer protein complex subunit gamma